MNDANAAWLLAQLSEHGLILLALLCTLEGPMATVAGVWLASFGILPLAPVLLIALGGEMLGDALHYGAGRVLLPVLGPRWRARLGLTEARVAALEAQYRSRGPLMLVVGKFTHAAGAAVLIAAGAARMDLRRFMLWTTAAGVPKIALLAGLGWGIGLAQGLAGSIWLGLTAAVTVGAGLWLAGRWLHRRRLRRRAAIHAGLVS